jgi:hypothetical protein
MWAREVGQLDAITRPEALRSDIIDGGRFHEGKVLAGFRRKRVSYYIDGSTVGPKTIYTVGASRIEMSGRCCCEFVRVFKYATAPADNSPRILLRCWPSTLQPGSYRSPCSRTTVQISCRLSTSRIRAVFNDQPG